MILIQTAKPAMPQGSISTDEEHAVALLEADRLWSSDNPDDEDALDRLCDDIIAYEDWRWPLRDHLCQLINHDPIGDVAKKLHSFLGDIPITVGVAGETIEVFIKAEHFDIRASVPANFLGIPVVVRVKGPTVL